MLINFVLQSANDGPKTHLAKKIVQSMGYWKS